MAIELVVHGVDTLSSRSYRQPKEDEREKQQDNRTRKVETGGRMNGKGVFESRLALRNFVRISVYGNTVCVPTGVYSKGLSVNAGPEYCMSVRSTMAVVIPALLRGFVGAICAQAALRRLTPSALRHLTLSSVMKSKRKTDHLERTADVVRREIPTHQIGVQPQLKSCLWALVSMCRLYS
eukprot:bmy_20833T0